MLASNQFPVLPTSGFLLNTTTSKSLSITYCCLCLIWKIFHLHGEQCQPTWGLFLERSIPKYEFRMPHIPPYLQNATFHFKSSNFTVSPLFLHLKNVKKQTFQNELSNRVSEPLLQRPMWLAKKTILHSEKLQRIKRNR